MKHVHRNCYNAITVECSINAHEALNIPINDTKACVRGSFSTPENEWGSETTTNLIIESELLDWKIFGTGIYPSIIINNITYRGQLEKLSVFNAICAGFANTLEICKETLGIVTPEDMNTIKNNQQRVLDGTMTIILVLGKLF